MARVIVDTLLLEDESKNKVNFLKVNDIFLKIFIIDGLKVNTLEIDPYNDKVKKFNLDTLEVFVVVENNVLKMEVFKDNIKTHYKINLLNKESFIEYRKELISSINTNMLNIVLLTVASFIF